MLPPDLIGKVGVGYGLITEIKGGKDLSQGGAISEKSLRDIKTVVHMSDFDSPSVTG